MPASPVQLARNVAYWRKRHVKVQAPRCRNCHKILEAWSVAVGFCMTCYPPHVHPSCRSSYHGLSHAACGYQSTQLPKMIGAE